MPGNEWHLGLFFTFFSQLAPCLLQSPPHICVNLCCHLERIIHLVFVPGTLLNMILYRTLFNTSTLSGFFFFLAHFQLLSVCPPHSQSNTAAVKLQLRFICDDLMCESKVKFTLSCQTVRISMFYGVQLVYHISFFYYFQPLYTWIYLLPCYGFNRLTPI